LKISEKAVVVFVCLLIACAGIVPWLFPQDSNDDTFGEVQLLYNTTEESWSPSTQWFHTGHTYRLTYYASRNNINKVLSIQYHYGYPIANNVSSWDVMTEVNLGTYSAVVVGTRTVSDNPCWVCEIDNETFVMYDVVSGILSQAEWNMTPTVEGDFLFTLRTLTLLEIDINIPESFDPNLDGLLLGGIFAELAIITWVIGIQRKKV
jgi:hypothetical protein